MKSTNWMLVTVLCSTTLMLVSCPKRAHSETIRFLISEFDQPFHGDSYVLALSDPDDIAHARQLISVGHTIGAPLAVAKIAKGANGINRNYLAPGAPAWSWHVSEFESFTDFTIEILDGWPSYVEGDIDGWIANTNSYIGFWTYTVTAELPQGDYDADLDVDAADYQVWRATFGTTSDLSADGDGSGMVDAADYLVWRKNLGRTATLPSLASPSSVPETHSLHMSLGWAIFYYVFQSRGIHRENSLGSNCDKCRRLFQNPGLTSAA